MAVLPANHVSVLCMELCVSGGSHTQYTYMIGPGAQPRSTPGPCKYFSSPPGKKKQDVLVNLRRILNCFGLTSGLKINYEKSAIIPLNCSESLVADFKRRLQCQVLFLAITYLGVPLGANPRKEEAWTPIIDKIKKRLSR